MPWVRSGHGVLLALSIVFLNSTLHAFTGTEGASFLELPVGARPTALGSAYSMLAEDAYAPIWNPAGLAFLDSPQLAATHMIYVQDTSYEYGSFVHPLGEGRGIGLAIQYFQPGTITGLDASGNSIGDISGYLANYTIALGQSFGKEFGIGFSGHLIEEKIDDVSAHAFAGSGGVLLRPNDRWRFAAVAANIGNKLTLIQSSDQLPLVYRIGAAYHPDPAWTFALEGAKQNNGLSSGHFGVEYETPFGFTLRTGYNTERTRELSGTAGVSVGISMLIYDQDFSYTWLPMSDLGSSHLISVVWHFGKTGHQVGDTHQLKRPPPEEDDLDRMLEN